MDAFGNDNDSFEDLLHLSDERHGMNKLTSSSFNTEVIDRYGNRVTDFVMLIKTLSKI